MDAARLEFLTWLCCHSRFLGISTPTRVLPSALQGFCPVFCKGSAQGSARVLPGTDRVPPSSAGGSAPLFRMSEEFSDSDLGMPGMPTAVVSAEEASADSADSLMGKPQGVLDVGDAASSGSGNGLEEGPDPVVIAAPESLTLSSWLLRGVVGDAQVLAVGTLSTPVARWAQNKEDIANFFDYAFNPA